MDLYIHIPREKYWSFVSVCFSVCSFRPPRPKHTNTPFCIGYVYTKQYVLTTRAPEDTLQSTHPLSNPPQKKIKTPPLISIQSHSYPSVHKHAPSLQPVYFPSWFATEHGVVWNLRQLTVEWHHPSLHKVTFNSHFHSCFWVICPEYTGIYLRIILLRRVPTWRLLHIHNIFISFIYTF